MITNVGSILKKEREKKNITIQDVEKNTRIRSKNIQAIENENWDEFPSRTYIQGIIKRYARFLELDEEKITAYFRREYEHRENLKFSKRVVKNEFTPIKKRLVQGVIMLIILGFSGFFGYQLYLYMKPPEIVILQPTESEFKRKEKIVLEGQAPPESIVTVNGKEVFLDDQSIFRTDIPLVEEKNKVVIEVTGANGKKTTLERVFTKVE